MLALSSKGQDLFPIIFQLLVYLFLLALQRAPLFLERLGKVRKWTFKRHQNLGNLFHYELPLHPVWCQPQQQARRLFGSPSDSLHTITIVLDATLTEGCILLIFQSSDLFVKSVHTIHVLLDDIPRRTNSSRYEAAKF